MGKELTALKKEKEKQATSHVAQIIFEKITGKDI